MKPNHTACRLFFLLGIFLSRESAANEPSSSVSVPVIAIELTGGVETSEIDEVVRALESPVTRGKALAERLGLVPTLDAGFEESVQQLFTEAQDNFFSGKHQDAEVNFNLILAKADTLRLSRLSPKHVREIVFKSHIQLAVIAHEAGDEKRTEERLHAACGKFPDLAPDSREFPPWICERYESIRKETAAEPVELALEASAVVRSKLLLGSEDVILVDQGESDVSILVEDALSLAKSGGSKRLIAVVGRKESMEVWLVDTDLKGIIRGASAPTDDIEALGKATQALLVEETAQSDTGNFKETKRPWYKDGLAWTMVGVGAALITTGFVLGNEWGSPSSKEPWAYTLIAVGGASIAGGVSLFFIPPFIVSTNSESGEKNIAIAAGGGFTF